MNYLKRGYELIDNKKINSYYNHPNLKNHPKYFWIREIIKTYNLLNELDISYLHVFTYSERPNTDAIKMNEVVSKEIRKERSKMLHILSDKKRRFFHDQFIRKYRPVLFENMKNGKLLGHTDNYIQIQMEGDSDLINSIHSVKLVDNHGIVVDGKLS